MLPNIFARVTGGNISQIEGLISANGIANLLLINPAGIVFGENASLDIGGSFFATTAESLLFPTGEFNAVDTESQPLLTINRPIGLRFGANPNPIINRSGTLNDPLLPPPGLQVQPGQNITLVGGEIQLDGGLLTASGGKIELGSVGEATQVNFIPGDSGDILGYELGTNFKDIKLTNLGRIDTTGLGGGEIRLQGRNILLTGGSKIISNTLGDLPGQDITLNASDSIQVLGTTNRPDVVEPILASFGIIIPLISSIETYTFGGGDSGDIAIDTQQLILEDGGQITTATLTTDTPELGEGGDITIDAADVTILGGAIVGEEGNPRGLIKFEREINGSSTLGTLSGNRASPGNITINTDRLNLRNGGVLTTNSFSGGGSGGNLIINATESIDIVGRSPNTVVNSIIASDALILRKTNDFVIENEQLVKIETEQLNIRDGGTISIETSGTGQAGNLEIDTRNLLLDEGLLIANTATGDLGNINVINADTILLRNNSQINTNATELSTGGDINLDADLIVALDNSDITAVAEAGRGGNIQITTQGLLLEPDSEITAASDLGIDGTVTFNTPDVDPTSGIFLLPEVPLDSESILARDLCRVENETVAGGSSFIVTGRSGLTPTSAESLDNINRVVNWADTSDIEVSSNGVVAVQKKASNNLAKNHSPVQAQGFAIAKDGSLWLTASSPSATLQDSTIHPNCQE